MSSEENKARLGYRLKKAREQQGYSIEDIQKITKLRAKYIKSIEENDFSVFSGDVYAKGSIRNYADIVGIDHEELWEEYELYYKIEKDEEKEEEKPEKKQVKKKPEKKRVPLQQIRRKPGISPGVKKGITTLIALALIVVGLWGGYNFIMSIELEPEENDNDFISENEEKNQKEDILDNDIDEKEDEDEKEKELDLEPEITLESIQEQENWDVFNYEINTDEELEVIGLVTGDRCWVGNFEGDGDNVSGMDGTYETDESFNITVEEQFQALIGRPRALELEVNGIEVDFNSDLEDNDYSMDSPFYFNITLGD